MNEKLSELEKSFVREWLKDENGKQAYLRIKSHVKDATAEVEASKLLRNPKVKVVIDKEKKKLSKKALITRERLVNMLLEVYSMSIEEKQGAAANQAVANIAKMCGLNEPDRFEGKFDFGALVDKIKNDE